jgi:hypothetical protein
VLGTDPPPPEKMEEGEAFCIPVLGAIPTFGVDGKPVGTVRFLAARDNNLYNLLHGDGLVDGEAAVLVALLRGRDYNSSSDHVAAESDLDGGDGSLAGAKVVVLHAARAWPGFRGTRVMLFISAVCAYHLDATIIGSPLYLP